MKSIQRKFSKAMIVFGSLITLAIIAILSKFFVTLPSLQNQKDSVAEAEIDAAGPLASISDASTDSEDPDEASVPNEMTPRETDLDDNSEPTLASQVDIIIDGDTYQVSIYEDAEAFQEMTLQEIVTLCQKPEFSLEKPVVLIRRKFSATAQAELQLMTALEEAGLTADDIDLRRTLIEDQD